MMSFWAKGSSVVLLVAVFYNPALGQGTFASSSRFLGTET
jgi:hypothetical protein